VNVQFIASMAVIAPDPAESRKLYIDALKLPLEQSRLIDDMRPIMSQPGAMSTNRL
jgi:hypothetical protein